MKIFTPVIALSLKGKFQVAMMKLILQVTSLFMARKWKYPLADFEENPLYFSFTDVVYFSYKYYHTQIRNPDRNSTIDKDLHRQVFHRSPEISKMTISLGGDLMPYSNISEEKCKHLWDDVGEYFFSSDVVFANLETPMDLSQPPGIVPEVMLKDMLFNGSEEIFGVFNGNEKYKGFDVLSVANNHSLDQGSAGLKETLKFLQRKNILYCGAAVTEQRLHDFPIIKRNGISVAFIAFTFSLNKFELAPEQAWFVNHIRLNSSHADISLIVEQAAIARKRGADIVIGSLHMGNAYQAYPSDRTQETMHRICREAGVDVVVGTHPHNPQSVEWYEHPKGSGKKSLILYSLGDFVAYDIYSWAHLALLAKLSIEKVGDQASVVGLEILPAYTLGESGKSSIDRLTFVHLERAYARLHQYPVRIQRDIESSYDLYSQLLFTSRQREQVIYRPHDR